MFLEQYTEEFVAPSNYRMQAVNNEFYWLVKLPLQMTLYSKMQMNRLILIPSRLNPTSLVILISMSIRLSTYIKEMDRGKSVKKL